MAVPWRKVKSHKISRLVNEHLRDSRKRRDGSSLVVETGFPTSLVDLFMKNREKLKKPSKKKMRNNSDKASVDADHPVPYEISPPIPSSIASSDVNEILDVGAVNGEESSSSLMVVFKMFLVVFFVLRTNRLTTGITITAFLVFFLDCLGNRLLSPSIRPKVQFRRLPDNQNSSGMFVQEKDRAETVENSDDSGIIMEEIQEETETPDVQHDDALEQQDIKLKKPSKRTKMKKKLKKFFSKILKGRRKPKTEEVNQTEDEISSQAARGSPSTSTPPPRDEDIVLTVASVQESFQTSKAEQARNKTTRQLRGKERRTWRVLMFFCLAILLGLLGSRPLSILLTVISFFLVKFIENRWAT